MDFNRITLVGRLVADPVLKEIVFGDNQKGEVSEFSIAVNRSKKKAGSQEADFFKVQLFSTKAKQAKEYLKKASLVLIEGRMNIDAVKKGETTNYFPIITASEFRVLEPKKQPVAA